MELTPPIQAIVTDIEGTTTSIDFVHQVLFPYARARLAAYIQTHDCQEILAAVRHELGRPDASEPDCIRALADWADQDAKVTPLKTLQGLIWAEGYATQAYQADIYPDVVPALQAWQARGIQLYVYSSGSIAAQKLLFGHTEAGDITPLFSGFFDTTIGSKKECEAYVAIAQILTADFAQAPTGQSPAVTNLPSHHILFLSDSATELKAAAQAGWQVIGLDRNQPAYSQDGIAYKNTFAEIVF